MIFPADEVVYLSYGRVIYIPSSPPANRVTIPLRTSLSTGSHTSYPSVPSTSTSSTRSEHASTKSSLSLYQPSTSKDHYPVKPARKKKLQERPVQEKHYLTVASPERIERLPANRIFTRGKSASPRNLGRDRTPFDFDNLFKREASPGRLSTRSWSHLQDTPPTPKSASGDKPAMEKLATTILNRPSLYTKVLLLNIQEMLRKLVVHKIQSWFCL